MDQKPIVLYLRMKRMALDAVHDDLVRTLGKDAVAYSTVTKYARSAQFSRRKETTPPEAPDVECSPVDKAIVTALAEFSFPFSSVRELSRRICLPKSTVHRHRHLTQSLRFTIRHFRWVPHFLTAEQKQIRVQMAIKLLQVLSVFISAPIEYPASPWHQDGQNKKERLEYSIENLSRHRYY
jgi:hypothetical protein